MSTVDVHDAFTGRYKDNVPILKILHDKFQTHQNWWKLTVVNRQWKRDTVLWEAKISCIVPITHIIGFRYFLLVTNNWLILILHFSCKESFKHSSLNPDNDAKLWCKIMHPPNMAAWIKMEIVASKSNKKHWQNRSEQILNSS